LYTWSEELSSQSQTIARRAGRSELSQLRGRDREGKAVVMHGGVHARPGALPRIPFLPGAAPGPSSPGGRPGLGAALRRSKTKSRLHFGPPAAGDLCKRAHRVRISHPALRLSDDPCVASRPCPLVKTIARGMEQSGAVNLPVTLL